jgi:hypothetical protein
MPYAKYSYIGNARKMYLSGMWTCVEGESGRKWDIFGEGP